MERTDGLEDTLTSTRVPLHMCKLKINKIKLPPGIAVLHLGFRCSHLVDLHFRIPVYEANDHFSNAGWSKAQNPCYPPILGWTIKVDTRSTFLNSWDPLGQESGVCGEDQAGSGIGLGVG